MSLSIEKVKKRDVKSYVENVRDVLSHLESEAYPKKLMGLLLKDFTVATFSWLVRQPNCLVLAARSHGQVIGFAYGWVNYGVFTIDWIGVRTFYREKGLGRALVERLVKECKRRRVHRVDMFVTRTDRDGISFLKRMNFKTEGVVRKYWGGCDFVVMVRWV